MGTRRRRQSPGRQEWESRWRTRSPWRRRARSGLGYSARTGRRSSGLRARLRQKSLYGPDLSMLPRCDVHMSLYALIRTDAFPVTLGRPVGRGRVAACGVVHVRPLTIGLEGRQPANRISDLGPSASADTHQVEMDVAPVVAPTMVSYRRCVTVWRSCAVGSAAALALGIAEAKAGEAA